MANGSLLSPDYNPYLGFAAPNYDRSAYAQQQYIQTLPEYMAQNPWATPEQYQGYAEGIHGRNQNLIRDAGFDPITGQPLAPQFESLIDPNTGQLKPELQLEATLLDPSSIAGYGQYETFATGTGPSEYATRAQEALDLQTMLERDRIAQEQAGATAQARSQLAMRGGLSSGARERVASSAGRDASRARQGARQSQMMGIADILSQDALNRQNALQNFTQMGANIGMANTNLENQAGQFNIQNALQEIGSGRDFAMGRYQEEGKKWAAEKKAQAERDAAAASCFVAGTPVEMADGTIKPIEQVRIGDVVKEGGEVYGLFQAKEMGQLYLYKNIQVTGWQSVFEDGKWMRVKDSEEAIPLMRKSTLVYDLCTKLHRIIINGVKFGDFAESDTPALPEEESLNAL